MNWKRRVTETKTETKIENGREGKEREGSEGEGRREGEIKRRKKRGHGGSKERREKQEQ